VKGYYNYVPKNVSVVYKDTKINNIDTPGHSDFGGEVERVVKHG
jgi:GTP-binding protein